MTSPTLLRAFGVLLLVASGAGWAEGNVRVIDCTVTRSCDASGECRAGTGTVTFRLSPQSTAADGSGRFTIRYGAVAAVATAQSEAGPFSWQAGQERHTLMVSSEVEWLWHQLVLEPKPAATIRFIACRYQR